MVLMVLVAIVVGVFGGMQLAQYRCVRRIEQDLIDAHLAAHVRHEAAMALEKAAQA